MMSYNYAQKLCRLRLPGASRLNQLRAAPAVTEVFS